MRINEILTESQLQQLDEGPIGSALGAVGRGIGKTVGGVAKGIGAVAGGVVGAGTALKKGYQSGKAVVGDDPDPNAGKPGYTAPVEPAPTPAPSTITPPSAQDINAQGPEGSAPAKTQSGDAGKALAKTTAVVDKQQVASQEKANQTVYAQVKANVDKLDKKGKQRILQMLQKSMSMPAPAAPANTMANAPVSAKNTAAATNPNQPPPVTGGKVAGQVSQTPGAVAKRGKRAAAKSASATGNRVMGNMVNQLSQQNASKINYGNALSEAVARRVEMHKQKMFESELINGTASVFVK